MPLDIDDTDRRVTAICAVMARDPTWIDDALGDLANLLGPILTRGLLYRFDFTSYYEAEMGAGQHKQLVAFEPLQKPERLAHLKTQTLDIERRWATSVQGQLQRRVNIDPGLVSESSLILATTKYGRHRIAIAPGLYAEITLLFEKGRYAPMPWTYEDYKSEERQAFLLEIRADLLARRRGEG